MSAPMVRRRKAAGFALIEMMIALVVLGVVMASALTVMRSQSRNFRKGGQSMELTQNLRYAMSTVDRVLRTLGAGVAPNQPMLVYAANDVVVFNANFASDISDGNAVYINPDLPAGAIDGLTNSPKITIPGTAIQYPDSNYFWGPATPSRAETILLFFRPDSTTAVGNDYVLLMQVNRQPAELISRNIKAYPGRPFFQYWYDSSTTTGVLFSRQLAAGRIPVRHTAALHGSTTDVGASALADSIRMIRINYVVTNGVTTADSGSRTIATMIGVRNNGLVQIKTCGDVPVFTSALTAIPNLVGQPPAVRLLWTPSPDETTGETDVSQYNIYYRRQAVATWEPWYTVAAGQATYDVTSGNGLVKDSIYFFAVAAQDCTPQESSLSATALPSLIP